MELKPLRVATKNSNKKVRYGRQQVAVSDSENDVGIFRDFHC